MLNIATLTLNPTIDLAYVVDRLEPTDKLRAPPQQADPGGGGINVARVFVRMGGNARCLYLSGGPTGIALDALLDLHQLVRERVAIAGHTRVSTTILENGSGKEFRVVPAGPEVSESEWQACLEKIDALECDYLVMSGSLPLGAPSDFYAQAATVVQRRGIRTVLDTSGAALTEGLGAGGHELIKPNLKEFQHLVGKELSNPEAIGEAAQSIASQGSARLVAVTMGADGGVLASADGIWRCEAPKVETASAVGAGDSFVAAMVYGLASGRSDFDAFRLGIAGGTAALITAGTGLAHAEDTRRIFAQIETG
ncbi:1-phosphofructokinase family hexose kinase [Altererythrobacter sp. Z27]|uniref:1-phosphofructokinase family hexose kinase n=1 Tax=Altererythrobacter sp. Z27 TaxID=3461147 RepID=UPI004044C0DA